MPNMLKYALCQLEIFLQLCEIFHNPCYQNGIILKKDPTKHFYLGPQQYFSPAPESGEGRNP